MSLNGQLVDFLSTSVMQNYMFFIFCFVDTVFAPLLSTVLIITLTEDFISMFVHFGLYFFQKIFLFINEEQTETLRKMLVFHFRAFERSEKVVGFVCLLVSFFFLPLVLSSSVLPSTPNI